MSETIGQTVDADLASIKAHLAALEAKAAADEKAVSTWIKNQWPHFVTWAGSAWIILKHLV